MRQLIAGNWKMNGLTPSLTEVTALARTLAINPPRCDVFICPPATLLSRAVRAGGVGVSFGGQDCHPEQSGPFTGDISAQMLRDSGAMAVIVGHSERRQHHGETDAVVAAKVKAAWGAGLIAIICIGETLAEREAGQAETVCKTQLAGSVPSGATIANTAIAYEPVWAIGTGKLPTLAEISATHAHIRLCLGSPVRVIYGGSVSPSNAREILSLSEVDGALVGGASLKAADFSIIVACARSET
jgi:triosephosphate isomerase